MSTSKSSGNIESHVLNQCSLEFVDRISSLMEKIYEYATIYYMDCVPFGKTKDFKTLL
jgi:hypothetical protein